MTDDIMAYSPAELTALREVYDCLSGAAAGNPLDWQTPAQMAVSARGNVVVRGQPGGMDVSILCAFLVVSERTYKHYVQIVKSRGQHELLPKFFHIPDAVTAAGHLTIKNAAYSPHHRYVIYVEDSEPWLTVGENFLNDLADAATPGTVSLYVSGCLWRHGLDLNNNTRYQLKERETYGPDSVMMFEADGTPHISYVSTSPVSGGRSDCSGWLNIPLQLQLRREISAKAAARGLWINPS